MMRSSRRRVVLPGTKSRRQIGGSVSMRMTLSWYVRTSSRRSSRRVSEAAACDSIWCVRRSTRPSRLSLIACTPDEISVNRLRRARRFATISYLGHPAKGERSSAIERRAVPRITQLLIEDRVCGASFRPLRFEVLAFGFQVAIHLVSMRKVEGGGAVDLLERQDREGVHDALGRLTAEEGVHDRVEGYTGSRDHVRALMLLDVLSVHPASARRS